MILYILTMILSNFVIIQCTSHDLVIIEVPKTGTTDPSNMIHMELAKRRPYPVDSTFFKTNDKPERIIIEEHYDKPTELLGEDSMDFNTVRGKLNNLKKKNSDNKIVGGYTVNITSHPYQASYGDVCGAVIIDKKWLISAAHCGKQLFVRVGSKHLRRGSKIPIKRFHKHPKYSYKKNKHEYDYDFLLLELSKPLNFSKRVQKVKIGHIEDLVVGKLVTVTGWGILEENGMSDGLLRAVKVPIVSMPICQSVKSPYYNGTLTPRMFCAGYREGQKDSCQGDSGGPVVARRRLLGVVSFGEGCARPEAYGVYSNVPIVRSWIEKITGLRFD